MRPKIAIVGSSSFPLTSNLGAEVVETMRSYGPDVMFLTRNGETGFDKFVATVALTLGLPCFSYRGRGGAANFARDAELVQDCTELVAFLDPAQLEPPYHGTAMLIERALNAKRPVKVATVADGRLVWA